MAVACLCVLAAGAGWFAWRAWPEQRGARLFDGSEPLAGMLSGHGVAMPANTTRCVQCHAGPASEARVESFGPRLDRFTLLQTMPRRGGPPSVYTLPTFCRALRSGIDPAQVTLPRAMPRFDVDDARCEALWTYLTRTTP